LGSFLTLFWEVLGGSWGVLGGSWEGLEKDLSELTAKGGGLHFNWRTWRRLGRVLGAVLALGSPSWAVLGRLVAVLGRQKIDVKIHQKMDALQDRILMRFGWILGRKMEASWHQNRTKIDAKCEKRFFEKSCSPCSGGLIF